MTPYRPLASIFSAITPKPRNTPTRACKDTYIRTCVPARVLRHPAHWQRCPNAPLVTMALMDRAVSAATATHIVTMSVA